ncbi:MAG: TrmB family transcriptional regulator [Cuniculiplasma sp.]
MEATSSRLEKVAEMLKMFGLSSYEAQAFSSLIYHGVANADVIADTAKIPRTSAYKVMESLVEKGYAKETDGRPKMFKPESLEDIRKKIETRVQELFSEMRQIEDNVPSKGDPQLVYTIYGRMKVMNKIAEIINLAEKELYICTPMVKEIRMEMKKNIENAMKRNVKVIFVTPPNKRVPANAETFRKEGLIATDVVADKSRALLAGPDLNACGYTDNPALALHVFQFVQMIIDSSDFNSREE